MHSFSHLPSDFYQLGSHSVCTRLAPEHKFALPRLATDECESQKREGFRFALSTLVPLDRRIASKLDQARLFPMQFEPELLKPLSHRVQKASCIRLHLKTRNDIVGISHNDYFAFGFSLSPLLDPQVKDVVQIDVGQQWR